MDLARASLRKTDDSPEPWQVWIPPRGPQDIDGDGPYGESYWPTWAEARDFLVSVVYES